MTKELLGSKGEQSIEDSQKEVDAWRSFLLLCVTGHNVRKRCSES